MSTNPDGIYSFYFKINNNKKTLNLIFRQRLLIILKFQTSEIVLIIIYFYPHLFNIPRCPIPP